MATIHWRSALESGWMRKLKAIYEDGVLKPTEPLNLKEHQRVGIIVIEKDEERSEPRFADPASFEKFADHTVDREALMRELAAIPGNMSDDIRAERDER